MSCFLPSAKAWRSLTSKLDSNLRKLRRSKALERASNHLDTLLLRRRSHRKKRKLRLHHHHHHLSFAPVYVDELFRQPAVPMAVGHVGKPAERSHPAATTVDVGRLGEVDARAERFINKFREEMRLQRQRSLEMYHEMLARGL